MRKRRLGVKYFVPLKKVSGFLDYCLFSGSVLLVLIVLGVSFHRGYLLQSPKMVKLLLMESNCQSRFSAEEEKHPRETDKRGLCVCVCVYRPTNACQKNHRV